MDVMIEKVRIGRCYSECSNDIRYQLQFKEKGEVDYKGLSVDVFRTRREAKEALGKHNRGEAVYEPFALQRNGEGRFLCKVLRRED